MRVIKAVHAKVALHGQSVFVLVAGRHEIETPAQVTKDGLGMVWIVVELDR